jgi:hypothetical protein
MGRLCKAILTTLAIVVFGAVLAREASAACGSGQMPAWSQQGFGPNDLRSDDTLGNTRDGDSVATIVGLWSVQFVAKNSSPIPDGTVVDAGYVTWHGDGTELMNSGRPPITGNFCMGVWKQTGRFTYKLNHVALSWDSTGTILVGPASIREKVILDRGGNNYTGTFTIDQFDQIGNTLAHVAGVIVGHRITPT